MAENQTEEQEAAPIVTMKANSVKFAEHVRNQYHGTPSAGHSEADIESREYWKHHSRNLRSGDHIELLWEDNSKWAKVIVVSADNFGASVCFLHKPVNLQGKSKSSSSAPFATKWGGPHNKWQVVRSSDGEIIEKGMDARPDAERYITEKLKAA